MDNKKRLSELADLIKATEKDRAEKKITNSEYMTKTMTYLKEARPLAHGKEAIAVQVAISAMEQLQKVDGMAGKLNRLMHKQLQKVDGMAGKLNRLMHR